MKKVFLAVLLSLATGWSAFAQSVTLDTAIRIAAEEISGRIEKGVKVAVLNISSSSSSMTSYIIDELNSALINDGRLTVVERDQEKLNTARQEMEFNDSEEVSNKSAQQIGRMLGAQILVGGKIGIAGNSYRLTIETLEVETTIKKYSKNFNIQNDQLVRSLMGDSAARTNLIVDSSTGDFTVARRVGAILLNPFFGAGSFGMKDRLGGGLTAAAEAAGIAMMVGGIILGDPGHSDGSNEKDDHSRRNISNAIGMTGGVLFGGGLIFGTVRALTFHKPGYIAALDLPLNIALVSDTQGNAALRFSYSLKF